ncbi:MaoC family dehydratase [Nisaea sp.]|uniref:MaoC family dehydratase n=1 Tax=Nisaea sp. TaxID=2024842 RepID=UPI003263D77B
MIHSAPAPRTKTEEFYPGFRFTEQPVIRTREYQDSRLKACGVDPALYGDQAAAGLFGQECFKAMRAAGHQVDGLVQTEQRFRQLEPVAVGETLTQRGWIEAYEEVPRGHRLHRKFEFVLKDGTVALTADVIGLVPDKEKWAAAATGKSISPPSDPRLGFELESEKMMTPEDVTLFSSDVGNLIHFQPEFAANLGYRAPLAQGLQTMVWMMGKLTEDGPPASFELVATFRRPVFWDEATSLWLNRGKTGFIDSMRTLNESGKLTVELMVSSLSYV